MAFPTVGRGRGRSRNLVTALRMPGSGPQPNKYSPLGLSPTSSTIDEVETTLTTCLKCPTEANFENLRKQTESFVTDKETNITKLIDLLCDKCFDNRDLASASGEIASVLVALPNCGVKLRGVLLKKIQESYKIREELGKKDFSRLLGFATLFCSLFKWLRVNDEPLKPLTVPVYRVLNDLLDGKSGTPVQREDEIETFHNCVLMVAETLEPCDEENKMNELFKKVRQTILNKASPKMRCLLMETLEYYASGNWANNDIKIYYSDLLSDIMATA